MKASTVISALICTSCLVYGQGRLVVANLNANGTIIPIYSANGARIATAQFSAALFTDGSATVQIGNTVPFGNNGYFVDTSPAIVPGVAEGGMARGLVLRVWDNLNGADYDSSLLKGFSPPFDNPVGVPGGVPPKLVNMPSFNLLPGAGTPGPDGPLIPEPSSMALGLMGIAAICWYRRR